MSLATLLDRNKAFAATGAGPWWELAVIHHTDCGSTLLADPELRRGFAAAGTLDTIVEPTPVIKH